MDLEPATDREGANGAKAMSEPTPPSRPSSRKRWVVGGLLLAAAVAVLVLGNMGVRTLEARRTAEASKSGSAAFARGDFVKAETALTQVASSHTGDAAAQALLGRSREAQGNLTGAVEAYSASLAASPRQPDVQYRVAVIEKTDGQNDKAIASLKRALAADATFFPAHLLLAELYSSAGNRADAVHELDAVIAQRPTGVDLDGLKERRATLQ